MFAEILKTSLEPMFPLRLPAKKWSVMSCSAVVDFWYGVRSIERSVGL